MAAFSLNYGVFFPGKIYVERDIYFKMLSKNLHPRPFNVPNGNGTLVGIFRSPICFVLEKHADIFSLRA